MRVGEIRARALRLAQYASIGTLVASVATALKVGAFELWYVVVGSVLLVVLAWVDPKVFKGESSYANRNNEEWQEVRKMVKEIHERKA